MSWAAVLAVAGSERRRRWVSMLVLGLLAGLVGAVVAGSTAVARRTATAYDRLVAATHLDDARVLVFSDNVDVDDIAGFPGVTRSWQSRQVIGAVVGAPVTYMSVSSGPARPDDLFTPVVVDGRAPRDDAVGEVLLPSVLADEVGLGVGDRFTLKLLTPEEVTQFDTGFGEPDGPLVRLTVVGIARVARAWVGNGVGPVIGTPALAEAYPQSQVGHNILVRLADGADGAAAFDRQLDRLREQSASGAAGEEFGVLQARFPTSQTDPEVTAAAGTLVAGQLVFIGLALLGGALALGQGLSRHHAAGAHDQRVEAALGLTRGERVLARLLPATLGAAIAAAVTAGGALLAGRIEPLGPLRAYEPSPGWLPDPLVVTIGAAATAAGFLALVAATAARVTRAAQMTAVGARTPVGLAALGRRAPAVAGMTFALRGGRGRTAVPVRATLVVAVLGIAGVVAVATFSQSLDRLVRTPARYGWVADFAIVDSRPFDLQDLAADARVAALADATATPVTLGGRRVDGVAVRPLKGDVPLTLLSGRLPLRDDEVALGSREANRIGATIGATLGLTTYDRDGARSRRSLRVVGLVVTPPGVGEGFGTGAYLTERTLLAAGRATQFTTAFVDLAPGVDAGALYAELSQRLELVPASRPAEVRNLAALGRLPGLLSLFLSLLAVAVLAHSLVLTARRRAPDLAVLRVIGLTPAQVGGALVAMATTIGAIGLALGPLLGLAVGRVVWGEVARGIGASGDASVPWLVMLVAVPVVLVGTAVVALLPAYRAASLRPAAVLRSE
ncbi:MAG TPA: FtsX-like permease family protein [Actinomycetes bacterium]